MKIFMPNKYILKFSLWLLPFVLVCLAIAFVGYFNEHAIVLNIGTVLLLLIILIFSVGSRIIRKDSMIVTDQLITYGTKEAKGNYLKLLLLQHEKTSVLFSDVKQFNYLTDENMFTLKTSNHNYQINVKGFHTKQIAKIKVLIEERIYHG